jgi:hypothetical protein
MLVRNGPALVGADFSTIDAPGFRFFAVSPRMTGGVAISVRAFAELLTR